MDITSNAYRRAFENYLRKGISIELQLKAVAAAHPTPSYVWRTREDEKVRPSHAANDGVIFAWDTPPPTGHPGEDFGCRCIAEPYYGNLPAGTRLRRPDADEPIEPVYPEVLLPAYRLSRSAISLAARLINRVTQRIPEREKPENLTEHGEMRWSERKITKQETAEAIKTAEDEGNIIEKTGKYGTLQYHYKGTNGVTVVVETQGRNAGKIITYWRH